MSTAIDRREIREWAWEHFHGVNNVTIPSFTHDLIDINEGGIRHDIRRDLELGFTGTLLRVQRNGLTIFAIYNMSASQPSGYSVPQHARWPTFDRHRQTMLSKPLGDIAETASKRKHPQQQKPNLACWLEKGGKKRFK